MAKTESTAVNELIGLVQNRQQVPPSEPGADLFAAPPSARQARMTSTVPPMHGAGEVAPLPRGRAPASTAQQQIPGGVRMTLAHPVRGTTIPPLAQPRMSAGTLPPPTRNSQVRTSAPMTAPVAAPFEPSPYVAAPSAGAFVRASYAESIGLPQYPIVQPPAIEDYWDAPVHKPSSTLALVKKLIAPTIVLAIVGVMVGGYFAFDGQGGKKKRTRTPAVPTAIQQNAETETVVRPALPRVESDNAATASAGGEQPQPPTKAEQAAEIAAASAMTQEAPAAVVEKIAERAPAAAAPTLREVQTPSGVIKFADVRVDSLPAGATVTLVDRGVQSFLGTTPLSTSLDSSREYDLIVAIDGRTTEMVHVNPATTPRIEVSLERKRAKSARTGRAAVASPAAETTDTAAEPAAAEATGPGTLMVSAKPPCEIYIDGKPTGLTTPQRAIELPAGAHKVTLVNEAAGIKKTLSVRITAGQATKLIQDLMEK